MKRTAMLTAFTVILSIILAFASGATDEPGTLLENTVADAPEIYSGAAYIVEANTNQVVFSYNADVRHYPASVTKIMTALLAVENGNLDDEITASSSAVYNESLTAGGSSAGIVPGEVMTLRELLYCLLLPSANESACVIAEYVSGSVEAFVELMNKRAAELGCTDTHFANPHGLHDENHYTTAHDLYMIGAEFAKHADLMEIANTPSIVLPATNKSAERTLITTNHLISTKKKSNYIYEYAKGIKTGYTTPAKHTLISSAEKDGLTFIGVVMYAPVIENSTVTSFVDMKNLFEWAFNNFSTQTLVKSGQAISEAHVSLCQDKDSIVLATEGSVSALLPKGSFDETKLEIKPPEDVVELTAPVEKGQAVAKADVYYDGTLYGTVDLVTTSSAELSNFMTMTDKADGFFSSPVFIIILVVIGVLVIGYIIFVALVARSRRRRKNSRRRYR